MQDKIVRTIPWAGQLPDEDAALLSREWLVTNALGGYASGTVAGVVTRRYHGLLVAALPASLGRTVMLSRVHERVTLSDGEIIDLTGEESANRAISLNGFRCLKEFRLEMGLPVWRYEMGAAVVEKRVLLPHQQNTVHITYRLLEGPAPVRIELRPSLHYRPQEAAVDQVFVDSKDYVLTMRDDYFQLNGGDFPPLTMKMYGGAAAFTIDRRKRDDILFRLRCSRWPGR